MTKIDNFFSPSPVTEGSGSEIPDFQFEDPDPDPKLLISDPEHWSKEWSFVFNFYFQEESYDKFKSAYLYRYFILS